MIIDTKRLTLRLLQPSDAQMILSLFNDELIIKNIGDKGIRTLDDALKYIQNGPIKMQTDLGFSLYCCQKKSDKQIIGLSGLLKRDGLTHPEIGFSFFAQYRGLGYGKETVNAILGYAKKQLNLKVVQAITNQDNFVSIGLLKQSGFSFNGLIKLDICENELKLFEKQL